MQSNEKHKRVQKILTWLFFSLSVGFTINALRSHNLWDIAFFGVFSLSFLFEFLSYSLKNKPERYRKISHGFTLLVIIILILEFSM